MGKPLSYKVPATTVVVLGREERSSEAEDPSGSPVVLSAVGLPPWLTFDGTSISGIPPKKGDVELEIEGKTATGLARKVPLLIRVDTEPSAPDAKPAKPSVERTATEPPKAKAPPALSVVNQHLGKGKMKGACQQGLASAAFRYPKIVKPVGKFFKHKIPKTHDKQFAV